MAGDLLPSDPESVGPYRLIGRLGAGGMGQVYLARSPGSRLVAVKVIRPELAADPGFRSRFEREVSAARSVSGMFTAPVVDADPSGQPPWLATAYVPGPSLADAVAERGPLPADVVLTLAAGLAEALAAIHAAGLVHRDLKPSNVLLAGDGPRVIDFGISRAADASALTQTGMIMGSPGFLSPEQAEGRPVGPPGDVFSLGAVLAYAASGAGPFGAGPAVALAFRVVHAAPDLSGVPEQLRPLISHCLAKDPADRPTPRELLASLAAGHREPQWLSPPLAVGAAGAGFARSGQQGGETTRAWAPAPPTGSVVAAPARSRRAARGGRAALVATGAAVAAAAVAGIALAAGGQGSGTAPPQTRPTASVSKTHALASRSAAPATATPAASSGPGAPAGKSPSPGPPAVKGPGQTAPGSLAVDGVWTGTYKCRQGRTGMQLTITGAIGGILTATFDFYPVAGNPDVADGSFELVGSYSAAGGLVLNPEYWIEEPADYEMVGLSASPPHANSMRGSVHGASCSTFSVTR